MWYLIITILTIIYLYINLITSGSLAETYILRPILWITLAIITLVIAYKEGLNILKFKKTRKWNLGKNPIQAALLLGGFQISLLIIAGIYSGFGESPYSFTPTSILINIFFVASLLIGTELSRAYLVRKSSKSRKYSLLFLALIAILFTLIQIPLYKFNALAFTDRIASLEFLGNIVITTFAINILATYLAYMGGASASISYTGLLLAFEWFVPILPNPHWIILALIGTIAPTMGYLILQSSITPTKQRTKTRKHKAKPMIYTLTIISLIMLLTIFFSFGHLGVEPTIISSGSMQPAYGVGDIAIIDEIEPDQIQQGDIIQFMKGEAKIMHRVIEITEDENGQKIFIVKGDANPDPDPDPVYEYQILGKAIFNVPKIGWLPIIIKEFYRQITTSI